MKKSSSVLMGSRYRHGRGRSAWLQGLTASVAARATPLQGKPSLLPVDPRLLAVDDGLDAGLNFGGSGCVLCFARILSTMLGRALFHRRRALVGPLRIRALVRQLGVERLLEVPERVVVAQDSCRSAPARRSRPGPASRRSPPRPRVAARRKPMVSLHITCSCSEPCRPASMKPTSCTMLAPCSSAVIRLSVASMPH